MMQQNCSNNILLFKDAIPADENSSHRKLTITNSSSVQPVSLLRLGVFTPNIRSKGKVGKPLDASESLSYLEYARSEGYTNVVITGPQLNYFIDFRCWLGIIHAFSACPDALHGNKIKVKFSEFSQFCGYPSKRLDSKLRKEIADSLTRIRAKTITFTTPGTKKFLVTGLLLKAEFDVVDDLVVLEADERLWELYSNDHLSLLRRKPLMALPRNETAQALYTYFEALPRQPAPIQMSRLRERLMMNGRVADQNRKITDALNELNSIGYLQYEVIKAGRDSVVHVHNRNPTLD
ncbi:repA protein [Providencia stuartii]|uniref:RepA protein n=2 Tax=Providencia TaxID=586 RepID=A0AAD2ZKZ7_PRORE|nr:repA protein [Providencia rettgeri]ELB1111381.1 repA protein [Morganella morganii]ELL8907259.1 repA protein [Proteus mirabilis]ELR5301189.1 repA protein [Providencia stuartii]MBG5984970.1 repA protein [Proteus vulgaris]MBQ0270721.1 repA protein [Providencia huaxiensis]